MERDNEKIIEITDLSKKYGHNWAVSHLNLSVRKGQIYGFLGPNGAGKSTTIRILMGLVKPTKGEYKLFGQKKPGKKVYSNIGAIVEEPQFYDYLTGRRNLRYLGELTGSHNSYQIDEILDIVNLKNINNKNVSEYSHGMKKRLGIAQALLHEPQLLILDEPTSGLDPEGIREIQELLKILVTDFNITIFLSSHHLREIESICTHMGIINYGKLVVEGAVAELLNNAKFSVTEVEVDRPRAALDILINQSWVNKISLENEKLKLNIASHRRPQMAKLLIDSGFKVYSIKPRRSIEDYYLSLIRE